MKLSCKTDSSRVLSYARMQNGLRAINCMVLKNLTDKDILDVTLKFSFDPMFGYESQLYVGTVAAKGKRTVDEIDLRLSTDYLANLSEITTGVIKVEAWSGSELLMDETITTKIIPYDYWEGSSISTEMLAAFVVPNHPEVKKILKVASEKLARWTGDPSLDDYQSDNPARVKYQMAAIYEAIRDLKITYATPPPSFYVSGQRVRMPEEIASTGLATCLDSALLYAGCLEAAGLHAFVVLNETHAYAGGWLTRKASDVAVNDDITLLSKFNADGINEVLLVETISSDKGHDLSFDGAVRAGEMHLSHPDDFCCFLDITTARNLGIHPLPLRVITSTGYAIQEPVSPRTDRKPSCIPDQDEVDLQQKQEVDRQVMWERKLLDLTTRNNLLNIHPASILQLLPPDLQALMESIQDGTSLKVVPYPQLWDAVEVLKGIVMPTCQADVAENFATLEARNGFIHTFEVEQDTEEWMHDLRLEAKHSLDENGANTLYLTCGSVQWVSEDTGKTFLAPLILIPVEIPRGMRSITMTDDGPVVNMTLLELMRQKYGIDVPGLSPLPEKVVDVRLVQNTIRRAIMDRKGWDVGNHVFLGNFKYDKFIIWNDIHSHQDMLDSSPVITSIKAGVLDPSLARLSEEDGSIDELCPADRIMLPISADSSQLKAIHDAMEGRSFVMHGPPGTGKSQTITNIIANALYTGKRVLFVSEKKAALDVVHSRLESIGLAPYCLELHSNKARKSAVLAKIESALGTELQPAPGSFATEAEEANKMRSLLNTHVEGLHKPHACGRTLYECVSEYLSLPKGIPSRRMPGSAIGSLTPGKAKEMEIAVSEFALAASHTGINGSCSLLGLPVRHYSADFAEGLDARMSALLAKKSCVGTYLEGIKMQRFLGTDLGLSLSRDAAAELRGKVEKWHEGLDGLRMYAIYNDKRSQLRACGLAFIAEEYEAGRITPEQIELCFRKSLMRSLAECILSENPELNLFYGQMFESKISRFREEEKVFMETVRQEICARMSRSIPDLDKEAVGNPEVAVLRKALRNGARGISLRTLFDRIPSLLPRICPCMLMSPLSVSQYLQPEAGQFDLVIFDEASQLKTCEAVASIARGKAVVVVGDPMQLPPTTFFESNAFDEDNADKEDQESILDECLAMSLPSNHLRWHYRSRHESLIAFSNANYYESRLLTFPSNDDISSRVKLVKVEGVYDRGRTRQNIAEAEAVADEVCRRLESEGCGSMGIIAFSVTQQHAIESALEARFKKNRKLERAALDCPEPLFVKSLENVQGDERDVILFSVGYGRDQKGRVSTNFGPVNQAGGWRRLNVAFSRSRSEMLIFSSIEPEDIHVDFMTPRGVSDLRAFLEYARNGRDALEARKASDPVKDLYVKRLAESLRSEGNTVHEAVGTSDFRVDIGVVDPEDPGRYLYGIICDGPYYASAESARDREITRIALLEGLGWDIKRKWILDSYGK